MSSRNAGGVQRGLWAIRQSGAGYTVFDLKRVKDEMWPVGCYGDFLKAVDRRLAGAVARAMAEPRVRVVNGVRESHAPVFRAGQ